MSGVDVENPKASLIVGLLDGVRGFLVDHGEAMVEERDLRIDVVGGGSRARRETYEHQKRQSSGDCIHTQKLTAIHSRYAA